MENNNEKITTYGKKSCSAPGQQENTMSSSQWNEKIFSSNRPPLVVIDANANTGNNSKRKNEMKAILKNPKKCKPEKDRPSKPAHDDDIRYILGELQSYKRGNSNASLRMNELIIQSPEWTAKNLHRLTQWVESLEVFKIEFGFKKFFVVPLSKVDALIKTFQALCTSSSIDGSSELSSNGSKHASTPESFQSFSQETFSSTIQTSSISSGNETSTTRGRSFSDTSTWNMLQSREDAFKLRSSKTKLPESNRHNPIASALLCSSSSSDKIDRGLSIQVPYNAPSHSPNEYFNDENGESPSSEILDLQKMFLNTPRGGASSVSNETGVASRQFQSPMNHFSRSRSVTPSMAPSTASVCSLMVSNHSRASSVDYSSDNPLQRSLSRSSSNVPTKSPRFSSINNTQNSRSRSGSMEDLSSSKGSFFGLETINEDSIGKGKRMINDILPKPIAMMERMEDILSLASEPLNLNSVCSLLINSPDEQEDKSINLQEVVFKSSNSSAFFDTKSQKYSSLSQIEFNSLSCSSPSIFKNSFQKPENENILLTTSSTPDLSVQTLANQTPTSYYISEEDIDGTNLRSIRRTATRISNPTLQQKSEHSDDPESETDDAISVDTRVDDNQHNGKSLLMHDKTPVKESTSVFLHDNSSIMEEGVEFCTIKAPVQQFDSAIRRSNTNEPFLTTYGKDIRRTKSETNNRFVKIDKPQLGSLTPAGCSNRQNNAPKPLTSSSFTTPQASLLDGWMNSKEAPANALRELLEKLNRSYPVLPCVVTHEELEYTKKETFYNRRSSLHAAVTFADSVGGGIHDDYIHETSARDDDFHYELPTTESNLSLPVIADISVDDEFKSPFSRFCGNTSLLSDIPTENESARSTSRSFFTPPETNNLSMSQKSTSDRKSISKSKYRRLSFGRGSAVEFTADYNNNFETKATSQKNKKGFGLSNLFCGCSSNVQDTVIDGSVVPEYFQSKFTKNPLTLNESANRKGNPDPLNAFSPTAVSKAPKGKQMNTSQLRGIQNASSHHESDSPARSYTYEDHELSAASIGVALKLTVVGGTYQNYVYRSRPVVAPPLSTEGWVSRAIVKIRKYDHNFNSVPPTFKLDLTVCSTTEDPLIISVENGWKWTPAYPVGYLVMDEKNNICYFIKSHPSEWEICDDKSQVEPCKDMSCEMDVDHSLAPPVKKLGNWCNTGVLMMVMNYLVGDDRSLILECCMWKTKKDGSTQKDKLVDGIREVIKVIKQVCKSWALCTYMVMSHSLSQMDLNQSVPLAIRNIFPSKLYEGKLCGEGTFKQVYKIKFKNIEMKKSGKVIKNDLHGELDSMEGLSVMKIDQFDDSMLELISNELQISLMTSSLVSLNISPNFLKIRSIFQSDGYIPNQWGKTVDTLLHNDHENSIHQCIRMEYCSGGDLEGFLRVKHQISVNKVRTFFFQMCFSLYVCREKLSMRHFDIKLLNYLITTSNSVIQSDSIHSNMRDSKDKTKRSSSKSTVQIGFGRYLYEIPLLPNELGIIKLVDFGTSIVGTRGINDAISVNQFTTLENVPPEFLILGSEARQTFANDTFPLGLCLFHLLSGKQPYEELLHTVRCPKFLSHALDKIWMTHDSSNPFKVIRDTIQSLHVPDQMEPQLTQSYHNMEKNVPSAILSDTLYRYLVLFGISPELLSKHSSSRTYADSPVWKLLLEVFEVNSNQDSVTLESSKYSTRLNNKLMESRIQFVKQYELDSAQWSIKAGSEPIMKSVRERLVELGGQSAMDLLLNLVHFDPSRRLSMFEILHQPLFEVMKVQSTISDQQISEDSCAMDVDIQNAIDGLQADEDVDIHEATSSERNIISYTYYYRGNNSNQSSSNGSNSIPTYI